MRLLRANLGVTRQDKLTNEVIRRTLKVDILNDTISRYRCNWFNYLARMDCSSSPLYMLPYKAAGKRSLDRPRKRWMSQISGPAKDESPMNEVEEEEEEEEEGYSWLKQYSEFCN